MSQPPQVPLPLEVAAHAPHEEMPAPRRLFGPIMRLRLLSLFALLVPSIACDQVTKSLAVDHLKGAGEVSIVPHLFRLVYAENPGAFLGLGRALPDGLRVPLFATIAIVFVLGAALFIAYQREVAPALFVAIALLAAGAAGNVIDRMVRPGGRVVDFAQLGVKTPMGRVQTGVFNVADVYIMGGVALALVATRKRKGADAAPSSTPSATPPDAPAPA
jgi:signal peptidase II